MAKPFPWTAGTIQRAEALALTVDKTHWLSTSGRTVLKIIDVLGKPKIDQQATVSQVIDQLARFGQQYGWNMPNMGTQQEKSFMVWLVNARLVDGF